MYLMEPSQSNTKTPNAGRQARQTAGARYERTLAAVACTPMLGARHLPPNPVHNPVKLDVIHYSCLLTESSHQLSVSWSSYLALSPDSPSQIMKQRLFVFFL